MTTEPGFHQQLIEARTRLRAQIEKLQFRPKLPNALGIGIGEDGIVDIDNSALIAKLTEMVREIDEYLAAPDSGENGPAGP